jgi:F420-dependent oxidoreductase-like protein
MRDLDKDEEIYMIHFGILTPQQGLDYQKIRTLWKESERRGFTSAWLVDHFIPYDAPITPMNAPVLECWTTLAALSRETEKLRFGPLVTCNLYRYPSVLAKMSSTLDVISKGRLEFGIGAGWLESECIQYGIPFPKISTRMEQLREAIQVIKCMWVESEANFSGKYYTIKNAVNYPKPLQKPHPRIWIGAEGDKMLRIAAEFADVWNFPSDIHFYSTEEYKRKVQLFNSYCQGYGRKTDKIVKSWLGIALIAKNERELCKKIKQFKPENISVSDYMRGIVGTYESCIEKISELNKAGATYFILVFPEVRIGNIKCLKSFSENIISYFKAH